MSLSIADNNVVRQYLGVSDEVCEQFLEGNCWLGENCWKRHPFDDDDGDYTQTAQSSQAAVYTHGVHQLRSGSLPRLVIPEHSGFERNPSTVCELLTPDVSKTDDSYQASSSPETSPLLTDDASNPIAHNVCWDFLRGRCARANCKYAHVPLKSPKPSQREVNI